MGNERPFGRLLGVSDTALFSGGGVNRNDGGRDPSQEVTALAQVMGIRDLNQESSFWNGDVRSSRGQNQSNLTLF